MLSQISKSALSFARVSLLPTRTLTANSCRCYAIKREVVEQFETEEEYFKSLAKKKKRGKKSEKKSDKVKDDAKVEIMEDEEFNLYSDIPKEILDLKYTKPNPASIGSFSRAMMNMKSRSYRDRHGSCLLEGHFLINDAMNSGMFVRTVYFSRLQNLVGLPSNILSKTNLVKVGFEEIKQASEVKVQTDGLLAIATKQDDMTRKKVIAARRERLHEAGEMTLPVTLICDNVRDAGNMGTVLRSAAAAGCEQVLVTKGCTDIWDSKTVRAGAGAHFKLPIVSDLTWDEVGRHMKAYDIRDVLLSHHSREEVKLSDLLPEIDDTEISIHKKLTENIDIKFEEPVSKEQFSNIVFKSRLYYDITFVKKGHSVVIIGGEVQGVSADACLYALQTLADKEVKGQKLGHGSLINIPMSTGNDCLNTAVAGSIILFEARRQMLAAKG